VAALGRRLGAQQHHPVEVLGAQHLLDASVADELQILRGIRLPGDAALPVRLEGVSGGREAQFVPEAHAAELAQEVPKVVALRVSGELRHVAQSRVDERGGTAVPEQPEELAGLLRREADGVEVGHLAS
jgi:hypothetical protein